MKNYSFEPFYKKGSRFINPHCDNIKRHLHHVFLWQAGYYDDGRLPKRVPHDFKYPNPKRSIRKQSPTAMWLNHCSFLIEIDGIRLLTDPIWSKRCSPFSFLGPRRRHEIPIGIKQLPEIHVVLISHNHYDHLDRKTVQELNNCHPSAFWIVPLGVGKWMKKQGIRRYLEVVWWEKLFLDIKGDASIALEVTAVPAQHFSGRTLFDKNKTLWVGYVVEFKRNSRKDKKLYFVGDTGYNRKDFKSIGCQFMEIDLSLIPIGTYVPTRFMSPVHINPQKAVTIHKEVRSKMSIGMHWKTFRLSGEGLYQPPYDLYRALDKAEIDPKSFRVLDPGQKINW